MIGVAVYFLPHGIVGLTALAVLVRIARLTKPWQAMVSGMLGICPWLMFPLLLCMSGGWARGDFAYVVSLGMITLTLFLLVNIRHYLADRARLPEIDIYALAKAAMQMPWWQIVIFPALITVLLIFYGRFILDYVEAANAHHYYHPMLMVENDNLKYIQFWTSAEAKPGTSKYVAALLGWTYLGLAKLTGIKNAFDPEPYFFGNIFVRSVMNVSFAFTGVVAALLTKELLNEDKNHYGVVWVGFAAAFLYPLVYWTTYVRDDILNVLPGIMAIWAIIRYDKSGRCAYYWISAWLLGFAFAYKPYTAFLSVVWCLGILLQGAYERMSPGTSSGAGYKRRILGGMARKTIPYAAVLVFCFIPGVLQPLLDRDTFGLVAHELSRWNIFHVDPRIQVDNPDMAKANFVQYLWGSIETIWDNLRVGHVLPLGLLTVIACFALRKNKYLFWLMPAFVFHLISLCFLFPSYRAVRYVTFELIVAYCLIGGLIEKCFVLLQNRSRLARWLKVLVVVSAIGIFLNNAMYIQYLPDQIIYLKNWYVPWTTWETLVPTTVLPAKQWWWFRNNRLEPLADADVNPELRSLPRDAPASWVAVGDSPAATTNLYVIPKDMSQICTIYPIHATFYLQRTAYDEYYDRIENVFQSYIPPKYGYRFIKRVTNYEKDPNAHPERWRNLELMTIVPMPPKGTDLDATIMVPEAFKGQIDVELVGRWAPSRRHIHRKVYHVYNNGGKLWRNASQDLLISENQLGKPVNLSIPVDDLLSGSSYYPVFINEIEIRFSAKVRHSFDKRTVFFMVKDVNLRPYIKGSRLE